MAASQKIHADQISEAGTDLFQPPPTFSDN